MFKIKPGPFGKYELFRIFFTQGTNKTGSVRSVRDKVSAFANQHDLTSLNFKNEIFTKTEFCKHVILNYKKYK